MVIGGLSYNCLLNNNNNIYMYHYIEYLAKYQHFLSIYMFLFLLLNIEITNKRFFYRII